MRGSDRDYFGGDDELGFKIVPDLAICIAWPVGDGYGALRISG